MVDCCDWQIAIDYIGVMICVAIGLVLILVMVFGCVCLGPARLCGACGAGIKKKPMQSADNTKRIVLSLIVLVLVGLTA